MTVNIIYPAVDRSIKDRLRMVQRLTTVSKVPDEALSLFISRSSTLFANHKYKSCAVFSSVFFFFLSFGATGQQVSLIVTMETRLIVQS